MTNNILEPIAAPAKKTKPAFTTGSVVVPAKGLKSLGLGVYNSQEPEPKFDFTCAAGLDEHITASLERLVMPGQPKYMLMYQFHNFGDKECQIEVVRK